MTAKNDETRALSLILTAVVLYSLFPLFNALSVGRVDPFLYVAKACVVAITIDLILALFLGRDRGINFKIIFISSDFRYLVLAAVLATLSYASLVTAFSQASNAAVTMLYELWPILFMFVLPIGFRSRFQNLTGLEVISSVIAVIGLAMIIFFPQTSDLFESTKKGQTNGLLLGFLSGILMAFANFAKSKAILSKDKSSLSLGDFALIDFFNRSIAAIVALALSMAVEKPSIHAIFQIDSSLGFGLIEGIGGLFYWIGLSSTSRSSSQLLLYLAPVIGFVWLYIFGLGELTGYILFGSMLIFAANVISHFKGDQTIAFFCTVAAAIIFGAASFLTISPNESLNFTLISPPITLYAILIGFLLSRLADRNFEQRQACLATIQGFSEDFSPEKRRDIIRFLAISFKSSASRVTEEYNTLLQKYSMPHQVERGLSSVLFCRISPISVGEMVSILFVGILVITFGYAGRPATFLGDIFAFILATIVIYLNVSIFEQKDIRVGEVSIMASSAGLDMEVEDNSREFLIAGLSLVVGIAVLVCLSLSLKHEIGIPENL